MLSQEITLEILEENLPKMAGLFGLDQDWDYVTYIGKTDNKGHVADCERDVAYQKALLTFDPERHENRADLLDSVRHELLHVLLSEFDVAFNAMKRNPQFSAGEIGAITIAHERTVKRLERLFSKLGIAPEFILSKAEEL